MSDNSSSVLEDLIFTTDCILYDELTTVIRTVSTRISSARLSIGTIDSKLASLSDEDRRTIGVERVVEALTEMKSALTRHIEEYEGQLKEASLRLAEVDYVMK